MSKTDNTRPVDVQLADRPPQTGSVPIIGGINGDNGYAKKDRKFAATERRQRDRRVEHNAKCLIDPDLIDVPPIRADRRHIGRRHL